MPLDKDANMTLLRLEEVATKLGISYTAARVIVLTDKLIPYITVGARGVRVEEAELEKYMELQKPPGALRALFGG